MARTYEFLIGAAERGLRLDHYLTKRLPAELSRAVIQRSIKAGAVTIAGGAVKAHHRLRPGERVTAHFEQLAKRQDGDTPLTPQDIPVEIVYEDPHLLVVNKPAGLVTHPAPGHWDGTLVNAILWHLGQGAGGVGHAAAGVPPRAGIVHRLDKETSGLLLVAKTETVHTALSRQLKARTIRRRYLALVEGHVPLNRGTVDAPIGRHQIHRKEMTIRHLGGRHAITHYRVLKRLEAKGAERDLRYSVLEVALDTGRTHQIRVHMAHLGYPVMGDVTYGRHTAAFWHDLGIERQLLHARELTFQHPVTRKPVELSAPVPPDIQRWVDAEHGQ